MLKTIFASLYAFANVVACFYCGLFLLTTQAMTR